MAGGLGQFSINPAQFGLNTQQSAAANSDRFASQLDNGFFDDAGKLVCRKGFSKNADGTPDDIKRVFWWRKSRTTKRLIAVGNASGTATAYNLTETTTPYDTFNSIGTFNSTDVRLVNCNLFCVAAEQGQDPEYYSGTGSFAAFAAATGTTSNPQGGVAHSAFGRLFLSSSNGFVVYGSELGPDPSAGIDWDNWFIDLRGASGGTAKDGWAVGNDTITAINSLGDYLVIFGLTTIMIYTDINGTPTLTETVTGVGCVNQHTVANTGDDLIFLSNSGLRSLRRTLEKDSPQQASVSAFIEADLLAAIDAEDAVGEYSAIDEFYLLSDGSESYYFDLRQQLPGGARRCSRWTLAPSYMSYDADNNTLWLGRDDAVGHYDGYDDDGSRYSFLIKSQWLDMGQSRLKIPKKMAAVLYSGEGYKPRFYVAYDWDANSEQSFLADELPTSEAYEWGDTTTGRGWGEAEWGGIANASTTRYAQAYGFGQFVRYGISFRIDGFVVGVHEIRIMVKMGKVAHV